MFPRRRLAFVATLAAAASFVLPALALPTALRPKEGPQFQPAPREIEPPRDVPAHAISFEDLDGDGELEWIWMKDKQLFVNGTIAANKVRAIRWAVGFDDQESASIDRIADVDGDGIKEIGVSTRKGTDVRVTFWGVSHALGNGEARRTLRAEGGHSYGSPDSGMSTRFIGDVTGDGAQDILCAISTGYGWKPRALICFDLDTGREHWRYDTGPCVTSADAADLDGDGSLEVVFGAYGPGNGNAAPDGTDDQHSYVWCLEGSSGRLLWKRETGTYFTGSNVRVVDLGDGPQVLTVMNAAHDFRGDTGRVALLGAAGAEAAAFEHEFSMRTIQALDLDGDQNLDVLLTDRRGALFQLGRGLEKLREASVGSTEHDSLELNVAGVADLDGDGRKEVLATVFDRQPLVTNMRSDMGPRPVTRYHRIRVLVLEADLSTVRFELPIAESWEEWQGLAASFADWDGNRCTKLIVGTDLIRVFDRLPALCPNK